ncbi:MAG: hypothetical protein A2268_13400 [Candidatus Raymondbacteria bacterium RifOxyA12_full_50_37]|uniref:HTH araC/xylS-type domain-containing protein n=1 Tax=Candidatus Raymondbacteria bacterium RIFOXYD12_FULL_49_13 TaxID=1817890 RepID=A0A1F7FDN3_UNCRA|nr:MAG: hypothetical protein A2268_13400 [Candidatus Raymondbacteria bacterium RifOxyA12_full_50_37]OGJ91814.1 MAG: hypothetical protein A2248_00290 [Candidatus Raymondbacteria bacterium RIFOXYA2_FULL_49_16]OGK00756.1 MAG: hypothetical protein A2350_18890 [Candidatus Raymondbacteria bacterium RifOxyB12_full_50_8]OGK04701.1 MAG: hypothetical protein A2519_18645 [Candidatus Raymondbacteria bacterium RIFOXYD12_FULL_49_13]OGK07905.1 MAG: hypothetical protein A2487_17350 [Candidatus Raymondbacteria 
MNIRKAPDPLVSLPFKERTGSEQRIYGAFSMTYTNGAKVAPHYHEDIEILVPSGVTGESSISGKTYCLHNGVIQYIQPKAIHSFRIRPSGVGTIVVLQIKQSHFLTTAAKLTGVSAKNFAELFLRVPVEHTRSYGTLTQTIQRLSSLVPQAAEKSSFRTAVYDMELLHAIIRLLTVETLPDIVVRPSEGKIRTIIDVIESVAHQPTSLNEIAKKSSLSKFHLCRIFKAATGLTVQTYLNQLRINRACRMLREEDKNVTETCFECGFSNLSYFIQVFSRIVGQPPKQWALALQ